MDLSHITAKLASELKLDGCFLFSGAGDQWSGSQASPSLRTFLGKLFKSRPEEYFSEIRFFKFRDEQRREAQQYLALVPVKIKGTSCRYLGLVYSQPERLQELLKYRIMPMYLRTWIHQIAVEERLREDRHRESETLLQALDERRAYADQLESKLHALRHELEHIREAEVGLDQKVNQLSDLLAQQNQEYQSLSEAYLDLFRNFESIQNEYIATCVDFEQTIFNLEEENDELVREVASRTNLRVGQIRKQREDHRKMKEALETAEAEATKYRAQFQALKESYGAMTPEKVEGMREVMGQLERKLEHYRKRCLQLELG
ncbi:hypothetical protein SCOR_10535 [Sulfidibacter corallicola]|uniref:Uncharacterized protein n=1 Tax=Sulfidibacter corallicola TaxID=2818388 RepID=A0A8A4THJ6_SULCO|nr:hypothetical protein [Sulfidibacter corallicola]QTD48228.1 hypothetical protein J3U87_21800 [Sulfidibacter corallicola]